jgi:hypothetical protein
VTVMGRVEGTAEQSDAAHFGSLMRFSTGSVRLSR